MAWIGKGKQTESLRKESEQIMRHLKKGKSLHRRSSHRKALLCNLAVAVLTHERIRTTEVKAKEVRGLVDRIITWGKRGDLHARRLAFKRVVKKVFDELGPRYRQRPGGYTRIIKAGRRQGDNAPLVLMELVDRPSES